MKAHGDSVAATSPQTNNVINTASKGNDGWDLNSEKDNEKDKETSSEVKNTQEYKKEKFDAIDIELDKLEKARKKKLKSKERKREQVELKQKISFLKDNNNFFIN